MVAEGRLDENCRLRSSSLSLDPSDFPNLGRAALPTVFLGFLSHPRVREITRALQRSTALQLSSSTALRRSTLYEYILYLLWEKLFRSTPLPPPSTCSAAEPTHPTAAQGHNELAYKCWYAQLDAYSNAATVILAGERRRHSVDSRIAMRRTACPDARLGALLWGRRKASGCAAQARPSG